GVVGDSRHGGEHDRGPHANGADEDRRELAGARRGLHLGVRGAVAGASAGRGLTQHALAGSQSRLLVRPMRFLITALAARPNMNGVESKLLASEAASCIGVPPLASILTRSSLSMSSSAPRAMVRVPSERISMIM